MKSGSLIESLKQEFLCYYHADLIPNDWKNKDRMDSLARDSAARLARLNAHKDDLILLFKELIANRTHPVNETLSDETDIEWCIEDEDWYAYRELLKEIVKNLEQ